MFTENQYLVEFSTIVKVSFQQTKRGFFHTLLHRSFSIPCDFILKSIIWRLSSWKTIIVRISWIRVLNYSCIRVSNKLYTPKVIVQDVPKRNIFVKLTFLGSTSFQIRKKFQKLFSDKLTSCDLKIVFTSPVRVKNVSIFKDKLPKMLLSGHVYKNKCSGCNPTYYGKTKHHSKNQICAHLGISHLTGKKVKIDNNKLMVIQQHLLCCNYSSSNDFKLKIMESLLIARDKRCLNKAISSLPLELFWCNISGYHTIFYYIVWCTSITLCLYSCRLFSFQYFVLFYQKQNVWVFNIILDMTMKTVSFES